MSLLHNSFFFVDSKQSGGGTHPPSRRRGGFVGVTYIIFDTNKYFCNRLIILSRL